MAQAPEILLDRRSGRSTEEFSVEQDLSLDERVALFEEAEMSHGYAETQLSRGYAKEEVYGETREIEEAIKIFSASAEYHATRIDEKEIVAALENKQIDPAVADAIRGRHKSIQERTRLDDAVKRAVGRYSEDGPDRSETHEEQSRDDDQER